MKKPASVAERRAIRLHCDKNWALCPTHCFVLVGYSSKFINITKFQELYISSSAPRSAFSVSNFGYICVCGLIIVGYYSYDFDIRLLNNALSLFLRDFVFITVEEQKLYLHISRICKIHKNWLSQALCTVSN